jgi:hypothetical protein
MDGASVENAGAFFDPAIEPAPCQIATLKNRDIQSLVNQPHEEQPKMPMILLAVKMAIFCKARLP